MQTHFESWMELPSIQVDISKTFFKLGFIHCMGLNSKQKDGVIEEKRKKKEKCLRKLIFSQRTNICQL